MEIYLSLLIKANHKEYFLEVYCRVAKCHGNDGYIGVKNVCRLAEHSFTKLNQAFRVKTNPI